MLSKLTGEEVWMVSVVVLVRVCLAALFIGAVAYFSEVITTKRDAVRSTRPPSGIPAGQGHVRP